MGFILLFLIAMPMLVALLLTWHRRAEPGALCGLALLLALLELGLTLVVALDWGLPSDLAFRAAPPWKWTETGPTLRLDLVAAPGRKELLPLVGLQLLMAIAAGPGIGSRRLGWIAPWILATAALGVLLAENVLVALAFISLSTPAAGLLLDGPPVPQRRSAAQMLMQQFLLADLVLFVVLVYCVGAYYRQAGTWSLALSELLAKTEFTPHERRFLSLAAALAVAVRTALPPWHRWLARAALHSRHGLPALVGLLPLIGFVVFCRWVQALPAPPVLPTTYWAWLAAGGFLYAATASLLEQQYSARIAYLVSANLALVLVALSAPNINPRHAMLHIALVLPALSGMAARVVLTADSKFRAQLGWWLFLGAAMGVVVGVPPFGGLFSRLTLLLFAWYADRWVFVICVMGCLFQGIAVVTAPSLQVPDDSTPSSTSPPLSTFPKPKPFADPRADSRPPVQAGSVPTVVRFALATAWSIAFCWFLFTGIFPHGLWP